MACKSDIIETLHMRLTLLQMTFGKHIERKHCCFFIWKGDGACNIFKYEIKSEEEVSGISWNFNCDGEL